MTALIREFVIAGARMLAFVTGNKFIMLVIAPREGGYSLVSSPDLPGFAIMLEPGESDDIQSLIDALTAPLKAYLEAEGLRNARQQPVKQHAALQPALKMWARSDDKAFAVASCA